MNILRTILNGLVLSFVCACSASAQEADMRAQYPNFGKKVMATLYSQSCQNEVQQMLQQLQQGQITHDADMLSQTIFGRISDADAMKDWLAGSPFLYFFSTGKNPNDCARLIESRNVGKPIEFTHYRVGDMGYSALVTIGIGSWDNVICAADVIRYPSLEEIVRHTTCVVRFHAPASPVPYRLQQRQ
jgi:hypothetical protein